MSNRSPKHARPKAPKGRKTKEKSSRLVTIFGLGLGVVGLAGLIALRPQVTVSPADALEHSQPFSVPFHITNASVYAVDEVTPTFYIHRVRVGTITLKGNLVYFPPQRLEHSEVGTVLCQITNFEKFPQEADVVVVIDYRISWIPFWHPRQYFRFIGQYGDNWQWLAEPIGDVRKDTDAVLPPR
jgi:hypothetical protein